MFKTRGIHQKLAGYTRIPSVPEDRDQLVGNCVQRSNLVAGESIFPRPIEDSPYKREDTRRQNIRPCRLSLPSICRLRNN